VITRHLNTQILKELGDTFQIADLAFTEQKPDEFAVPLESSAGRCWAG
jgi:hypothetical protein